MILVAHAAMSSIQLLALEVLLAYMMMMLFVPMTYDALQPLQKMQSVYVKHLYRTVDKRKLIPPI